MKVLAAFAGAFVLSFTLATSSTAATHSTFSATRTLTTAAQQERQAAEQLHRTKAKLHRHITVNRRTTWSWQDKSGLRRTPAVTIGWKYSPQLMRKVVRLWHDRAEHARVRYQQILAAARAAQQSSSSGSSTWDALAGCESGRDWSYNGSSGFDGGLQFEPGTWSAHKLPGYPAYAYQASREQQIAVAERVLGSQGWGAWPACSAKLGLG